MATLPVLVDSLDIYLAEIRKFPSLTPEEEYNCAVKFAEEKDLESAHKLVTSNLRFVVKIAYEYKNYGLKMVDIIQEGNIGLMMAVKKFDPYKGIKLCSYAVWWIRSYIHNHIMSCWSLVKIGTTGAQRKLFYKMNQTKNALIELNDGNDTNNKVNKDSSILLNVKEKELSEMSIRMMGDSSLNVELVDENGDSTQMQDSLVDERMNQEELLAELQEESVAKKEIAEAMKALNEKERFIIEQRITADVPMKLAEIALHYGFSKERARQVEESALKKLRKLLADN